MVGALGWLMQKCAVIEEPRIPKALNRIDASALLFDTPVRSAPESQSLDTVYPTLAGGTDPRFFGNDGIVEGHLRNVKPQLSSFYGVYDWRWDAEHGDEARSIAEQLSMTHNGPQVVVIDRHGLFAIQKLGGKRVGKAFIGGMERDLEAAPEAPVEGTLRPKVDADGKAIDYRPKWGELVGHEMTSLRDLIDISSEVTHKPLDEVQLFLAAGDPSSTDEELDAAEKAAAMPEAALNLPRRREVARRELDALAKVAKKLPKMIRGQKSKRWSYAWKQFYRRREELLAQGLVVDPIAPAQAAKYRAAGAYVWYSLASARRFAKLASSGKMLCITGRNVIVARQEDTGHYYCFVNCSPKDPASMGETWFAGRPTPSPYRRGDFKRTYTAVLTWAGGSKPESRRLIQGHAGLDHTPAVKGDYDYVFGTSFGNRWLDEEHLEVRKLPTGKGGYWSDFRAVTDEEAMMLLEVFFGSFDWVEGIDSAIVQAVEDDNERSGADLVGGYEATPLSEEDSGEGGSFAWHERQYDAEAEEYLQ